MNGGFDLRVDVVGEGVEGGGGELTVGDHAVGEDVDGVALQPLFEFAGGTVGGGIGAGVTTIAIGFGFDEGWASAGLGVLDGFEKDGVQGFGILSIDDAGGDAIGGGAVGDVGNGSCERIWGILAV